MCGLAGFLHPSSGRADDDATLLRMGEALRHRGPDDGGIWTDKPSGIGLSHRRLSIVDLSPAGHQPMQSASGRFVIAYNGEIYNHLEIRAELEQKRGSLNWRGHSDTETLLAAIEEWGVKDALRRCVGMFAMALWCRQTRTLTLARDRLGEKPLYYGWQGLGSQRIFLFGSELKSIKAHPAFSREIDRNALALFLRHSNVPAPYCIFKGISKLLPGHLLTLGGERREPLLEPYWSASEVMTSGAAHPLDMSDSELIDELERILLRSVGQQMAADVPLGAFLSGGVDSSTVVALMQTISSRPIKTFTIGFDAAGYDESGHAKAVATHLCTDHTELYVTADDALGLVPTLPGLYDEPFADSSQIPTILVSRLARRDVTVSLSGDGGDELFAGYNRYAFAQRTWPAISKIPYWLRHIGGNGLSALPSDTLDWLASAVSQRRQGAGGQPDVANKVMKIARGLRARTSDELYYDLVSHWKETSQLAIDGIEPPTTVTQPPLEFALLTDTERMMAWDMMDYLPNDILTKLDRAAMSVSLESRAPLLDHRVAEFAWRIPLNQKMKEKVTKWPLRQVLYRHVPRDLIERPKVGFGVPLDAWLRGPLRDWASALLDDRRLASEGYLNPVEITAKWQSHLSGRRNWGHDLWDVLMFQQWLEHGNRDTNDLSSPYTTSEAMGSRTG